MKKILLLLLVILSISTTGALLKPVTVSAADVPSGAQYTPLAPINLGTGNGGTGAQIRTDTIGNYVIDMYKFAVGIAAVLAIIMIVIGGIQYMSTDAIYAKTDGKEKIQQALWGLLLVIISYLILNTINPNLVSLKSTFETTSTNAPATAPTPTK